MNEWMLGGLVVVGTVLALGGGGWILRVLGGRKDPSNKA